MADPIITTTLDAFIYSGMAGGALGSLIGVFLTFQFQKKLLRQQLEFQQSLLDQQLAANETSHKEHLAFLAECAHRDYVRGENLTGAVRAEMEALIAAIKERPQ
jgi:hypothetical protein